MYIPHGHSSYIWDSIHIHIRNYVCIFNMENVRVFHIFSNDSVEFSLFFYSFMSYISIFPWTKQKKICVVNIFFGAITFSCIPIKTRPVTTYATNCLPIKYFIPRYFVVRVSFIGMRRKNMVFFPRLYFTDF